MAVYEYKGFDLDGRKKSGFVDGDSVGSVKLILRDSLNIYPTSIKESKKASENHIKKYLDLSKYFNRVKPAEISLFTRQLSTLISSGFQLTIALKTITPQIKSLYFKRSLSQIKDSVEEGTTFAKALALYPDIFSETYINLVHAGENSGTLDIVLERLAASSEDRMKLDRKIRVALTYPAFMAVIACFVVIFLITYVVPGILDIFKDMNHAPPLPTRILIYITDIVKSYWFVFPIILIALHLSLTFMKRNKKGKYFLDRVKLSTPYSGDLIKKLATARFTRTLSTLLENGVTLLKALGVAQNVMENVLVKEAILCSSQEVEQGGELGRSLSKKNIFPVLATEMIKVGEQTGQLEKMLNKIADIYEDEVEAAIMKMTALIEPMIILIMGGVALLIMLSVYLPIMEMNTLAK